MDVPSKKVPERSIRRGLRRRRLQVDVPSKKVPERSIRRGLNVLSVVGTLIVWQLVGANTNPLLFASPLAIVNAAPEVIADGLFREYVSTMVVFLSSLVAAVLAGAIFGIITGLSKHVRYFSDPLVISLYSTPGLVLIPLLVLWMGIGVWPKVTLVFLAAFFPTLINTQLGVQGVGPEMMELGKSLGANRRETIRIIIVPAILPYVLSGFRIAAPRAFVTIIGAEMLISVQGIGGLILTYGNQFQTAKFFVPVLLVLMTALLVNGFSKSLEKRLTPWRPTHS